MKFYRDVQKLMDGLVIYRRSDVAHERFNARIALGKGIRKYKVIALEASTIEDAKPEAMKRFVEIQFAAQNNVPIFKRTFDQVAKEFLAKEQARTGLSGKGGITQHRYRVQENLVKMHLSPYLGSKHISAVSQQDWIGYAAWRQTHRKGRDGGAVSGSTIRSEMTALRTIMTFAAVRGYVNAAKIKDAFNGRYLVAAEKRDALTRSEYRALYRFMRRKEWLNEPNVSAQSLWTRQIVRNFILIMAHTGMRNSEARNLRWQDIHQDEARDRVVFTVHGKRKRRTFEAAGRVAFYLDRIRRISKSTAPNDFVFSTFQGRQSKHLYAQLIANLLDAAEVAISSSGKRRSTYSLRHSFATWRLQAGADAYALAKHMGTSVAMIQYHYGHVTTQDVADAVLKGLR